MIATMSSYRDRKEVFEMTPETDVLRVAEKDSPEGSKNPLPRRTRSWLLRQHPYLSVSRGIEYGVK